VPAYARGLRVEFLELVRATTAALPSKRLVYIPIQRWSRSASHWRFPSSIVVITIESWMAEIMQASPANQSDHAYSRAYRKQTLESFDCFVFHFRIFSATNSRSWDRLQGPFPRRLYNDPFCPANSARCSHAGCLARRNEPQHTCPTAQGSPYTQEPCPQPLIDYFLIFFLSMPRSNLLS